ncbi:MAG: hypothetical protein U5L06_00605 [Rhodovibrio sp.]|nr:hypothetical protein [Rhodovibrio sp.]
MLTNVLPSDRVTVADVIDPDAYSTGTQTTGWINMEDFHAILAIVMAGTLGTSATIDAKLEQAQDGSGTGAKDVSGKAITQLTQAGPDESDKQALINCYQRDLDIANGFTHVRLSLTVGTASSDAAGLVVGVDARYKPGTQDAAVAETV